MNIVEIHDGTNEKACEICGKIDELRPYGPKGEWICFDCGMKDEQTTRRQFVKLISSADVIVVNATDKEANPRV